MALLGERVPGARGPATWGLVDGLTSDDTFAEEVDALAERLATGPTRAYAAAKAQFNARVYAGLDEQLELEASLQQETGRLGGLRRGRPGLPGEARGELLRRVSCPALQSIHCAPDGPVRLQTLLRRAIDLPCSRCWSTASPAAAGLILPEAGGGSQAGRGHSDALHDHLRDRASIVFVGVEGVLIYCLFKYRARKGRVAAQIHGNTRLEIGWTVGAAVILVFLTVATFVMLPGIKNPAASDIDDERQPGRRPTPPSPRPTRKRRRAATSMNIDVDGMQYVWRFAYPRIDDKKVYAFTTCTCRSE